MDLAELPQPFVRCLDLAWQACAAGTVGVGAVITDAQGNQIAEGGNQLWVHGDAGPLARNRLAHAENNALARLDIDVDLRDATLWTSLEPCIMCAGSLVLANVGRVRVLAEDDFMAGIERVTEHNEWIKSRWREREYHHEPTWGTISRVFSTAFFVVNQKDGAFTVQLRERSPELAQIVEEFINDGRLNRLSEGPAPLVEVVSALSPDVSPGSILG